MQLLPVGYREKNSTGCAASSSLRVSMLAAGYSWVSFRDSDHYTLCFCPPAGGSCVTMGSCVFGEEAEEARMGTFKQATIMCCLISIVMAAVGLFMLRRWHKAQLKKKEYEDELSKLEDEENNAPLGSAIAAAAAAAAAAADAAFEDGLESFRSPRWEENRDKEFDNTENFDPNQIPEITTPFKWCELLS